MEVGRALDSDMGVGGRLDRLADEEPEVRVETGLEVERDAAGVDLFLRLRSSWFASFSSLSRNWRASFLGGLDIIWEIGEMLNGGLRVARWAMMGACYEAEESKRTQEAAKMV